MHLRTQVRPTRSGPQRYVQLVQSYRKPGGMPATRVLAHLGVLDDVLVDNLKAALAAARRGARVSAVAEPARPTQPLRLSVQMQEDLLYLPLQVVSGVMRRFGLKDILDALCPPSPRSASVATVVEALIAHRCLEPDSKVALQRWMPTAAIGDVLGVEPERLNNTRVHRVMEQLGAVDAPLQEAMARRVLRRGTPRVLYLDLTDTWFVAGGGSLARRNQTKEGHRSKLKIHIALMVDQDGLPLRWQLLPGALSETTVLPSWVDHLQHWPELNASVLVFDRGMPSVANLCQLTDAQRGHLFLTSIKSDAIPTYVPLPDADFDRLQALPADPTDAEVEAACGPLGLQKLDRCTYARELGVLTPPRPSNGRKSIAPRMHMYLYFNPEMQTTRRQRRAQRLRQVQTFVEALNAELRRAAQPRKEQPTLRKVLRVIEKHSLSEIYEARLVPHAVQGKSRTIASWQVVLTVNQDALNRARRYDGVTLLLAHPDVGYGAAEAVRAYREKAAVEADFRTIKSVLCLRPTFHRTDLKIREHVTLCVLALLVERLIELQLAASPLREAPRSANALLAELGPIRLTRLTVGEQTVRIRTQDGQRTRQLLAALELDALLDHFPTQQEVAVGP